MATSAHPRRRRLAFWSAGVSLAVVLLLAFVPAAPAAFHAPNYSNAVATTTTDFRPSLESPSGNTAYLTRWDRASTNVINDDVFYVSFRAAATVAGSVVAAGDVRIVAPSGSGVTAGQVVATGDADIGQTLIAADRGANFAAFLPLLKFLENDGTPGFTAGDLVYVDTGDLGAECAAEAVGFTVCDLRLTPYSSLVAGTLVNVGDADLSEFGDADGTYPDTGNDLVAFTGPSILYFDGNENNVLDRGSPLDTVYVRLPDGLPSAGADAAFEGPTNFIPRPVVTQDLRLTAFASHAFGTLAAVGNTDVVPLLEALPASRLVCTPAPACAASVTALATDRLLLSFDQGTLASRLQPGDLTLNTATGQTMGTFLTTGATGVGIGFSASATAPTAAFFFVDLSPSGFGEEDPVYLNRPADIGGAADAGNGLRVSVNDVRATATSGGAAGSAVASGAADLVAYQTTDGTAMTAVKFFDADRGQPATALRAFATGTVRVSGADGAWASATELVYASGTSTALASPVAAGHLRVNGVTYAEDSTAECTTNQNADCGDTLFSAWTTTNIYLTGGDGAYAGGEDAYISTDTEITDGDVRLTPTAGGAVGSVVSCAATPAECAGAPGELTLATNPCITGADATWNTGEVAYQNTAACPATVTGATLSRITPVTLAGATAVASTDPDLGLATTAATDSFKVTGADGVYTASTDNMYVSANLAIGVGDTRVNTVTLGAAPTLASASAVLAGEPDIAAGDAGPGDTLYLSHRSLADAKVPLYSNVRLAPYGSNAAGGFVAAGTLDYTPRVLTFVAAAATDPTMCVSRTDRSNPGQFTDDAFYLSTSCGAEPTAVVAGDIRLTIPGGLTGLLAGSIVQGGDADIIGSANTRALGAFDSDTLAFRYIDGPNSKAGSIYDSGDLVYVEQTLAVAGDNALSAGDLRLKSTVVGGQTFAAGTIATASNTDVISYPGTANFKADPDAGTQVFRGKFLDKDGDAAFDTGEHVILGPDAADCTLGTKCTPMLRLGDLYLSGTATTPSSGGGGGSTVVTTTSTTSGSVTSSTSASVTDSSTSGTGTDSGTFTTGTGTDTGTGTGDGDGGGDNSTPGLGFAVLVFALAAAVLVARRKL